MCLFLFSWSPVAHAADDVPGFNAYLGDVKLDVQPIQAVNCNLTLRVSVTFWGGCCNGCPVCGGFHARKMRIILQIPSELTLVDGINPHEFADIVGIPAGKYMTLEASWTFGSAIEGKFTIEVTVVTENTMPREKQVSCEVSIVRSLVVNQPSIMPKSPTINDDVTISVNISNPLNVELRDATLNYYTYSETFPAIMLMHKEIGADSWYATISKQPESVVSFYVEVFDINGNSTKSLEYSYKVEDPMRVEAWYKNVIFSVVLTSLVGLFFITFVSYSKYKRKQLVQHEEFSILKKHRIVPHYRVSTFNDRLAKSKISKRRIGFIACIVAALILLCLVIYYGQFYEWVKFLGS